MWKKKEEIIFSVGYMKSFHVLFELCKSCWKWIVISKSIFMPYKLVYYSEAHKWCLLKIEVCIQEADKCWCVENAWTNSEWLVIKPIARIILRWIQLAAPDRTSDTAGMPMFVCLLSPLEARRCLSEAPPTAAMTVCPTPLPVHTSMNSLNYDWTFLLRQVHF